MLSTLIKATKNHLKMSFGSFGSFVLLPNITGSFNQRSADAGSAHGCISVSHTGNFAYKLALNADARAGDLFDFNASRSSSIYGASNIVQPNALIFYYIIKY